MRSRGSWLSRVCAFAVLLVPGGAATSCSRECNARFYDDLVRIAVPVPIPTSGATICVHDHCQPAFATDPDGPSSVIVNGVAAQYPHAVQIIPQPGLGSGSVKIRFVMAGSAPIDAVVTTKPKTDTHGGCATQRLVSLQYDPFTRNLAVGPDIPVYER